MYFGLMFRHEIDRYVLFAMRCKKKINKKNKGFGGDGHIVS